MSTIIKLRCIDQVLTLENTPVIASGGLEEDFIQVSFCSKWDGLVRTAVFWRSEKDVYHVQLDENDTCAIPKEVLIDDGSIYFGLFGVSAEGKQRTSQAMRYTITKGAITSGTKPSDPTPDIYTELIAKYNEMIAIAADTRAKEQAFEQAMTQRAATFETNLAKQMGDDQAAFEQVMTKDQADFEQEIKDMIAAGLLPDDSVTTVKLKNGVVTTAKIADSAVTTAKVAKGAITAEKLAEGVIDAYTKAQTLTAATAALFGLGSGAVPNDVFSFLGKLKQHCWEKTKDVYAASLTSAPTTMIMSSSSTSDVSIQYSSEVSVSPDFTISLVNPQTISIGYNTYTNADVLKGKYFITQYSSAAGTVLFAAENAEFARQTGPYGVYVKSGCSGVSGYARRESQGFVYSSDRNAFADGKNADGFNYYYVGVPFENAAGATKIETGSYTGTGKYGSSNKNRLTFDIVPAIVIVFGKGAFGSMVLFVNGWRSYTRIGASSGSGDQVSAWEDKTLTWYSTANAGNQFNSAGDYGYIAIG